jgi:hypothetical protein
MPRIFISYRRDDSAGHAGRLYDRLVERFGEENIFLDVMGIAPGQNFVEKIEQTVRSCNVLIAVIGRHWLTVTDRAGRRRLDDSRDFVRLEILTALNHNILVIPVLVQNASMPSAADLPEPLAELAWRNAAELRDVSWRDDVNRLITGIERIWTDVGQNKTRSIQKHNEISPTAKVEKQTISRETIAAKYVVAEQQVEALAHTPTNISTPYTNQQVFARSTSTDGKQRNSSLRSSDLNADRSRHRTVAKPLKPVRLTKIIDFLKDVFIVIPIFLTELGVFSILVGRIMYSVMTYFFELKIDIFSAIIYSIVGGNISVIWSLSFHGTIWIYDQNNPYDGYLGVIIFIFIRVLIGVISALLVGGLLVFSLGIYVPEHTWSLAGLFFTAFGAIIFVEVFYWLKGVVEG